MTYFEAYKQGLQMLIDNNIEDANFDNRLIFENCFGLNRTQLAIHQNEIAQCEKVKRYLSDIKRRSNYEPLQYIIGIWEFMGYDFKVGKGVLVPREETEIIVQCAIEQIQANDKNNTVVFDLCSGSGCIGISIARLCPNATVYLIEKSKQALQYLIKNVEDSNLNNIKVFEGDITKGFSYFNLPNPDIIVSNPPYIKTNEIKTLQAEVQNEPNMALDGGESGLYYYKAIYDLWSSSVTSNGAIILEIGENQENDIEFIFKNKFEMIKKIKDFNNIYRTLVLRKNKST